MKKLIIIITILGLGFAGYYTYKNFVSRDIKLSLETESKDIQYGKPFDIEIRFENNSQNTLANTSLVIGLPQNIVFANPEEEVKLTRDLGEIKSGGTHHEKVSVIALPGEDPDYKIKASAFYSPSSVVAEFKKETDLEVQVSAPKLTLEINTPERIFQGEEFEASATYKTEESLADFPDIKLSLTFPDQFIKNTENPASGEDGAWQVQGADTSKSPDKVSAGVVIVTGSIQSPEYNNFDVRAELSMHILDEDYVFLSASENISIEPSPLSFDIVLGEQPNTVGPGDNVIYILRYKNNTNVQLRDAIVRAELTGEMFDLGSINTDATLSNSNSKITWTGRNAEELRTLEPGESGEVGFSIKIKEIHPIERVSDKDFYVKVKGSIESPTVPNQIKTDRTINTAELETKVKGLVKVGTQAFFRDLGTGVVNSGPFPPRVGQPTEYTVHWSVSNFGTDVSDTEVHALLEPGVEFVKVLKNNSNTSPEYNPTSRELVWKVGDLLATTGVVSQRPEIVFQIKATPNSSQRGNYMPLISETVISAHDLFSDSDISSTRPPISTRLSDDSTINEDTGRVVE